MATERQVEETIARGISTMVYYHNSKRSPKTDERLIVEVEMIVGFVQELGLDRNEAVGRIIRPVADGLIVRYGQEIGPRLASRFASIFNDAGTSGSGENRGNE